MKSPSENCSRCGASLTSPPEPICHRCLLESMGAYEENQAEKIFQAALAYEADERSDFVEKAAKGNEDLLNDVQLLLQGYEEAGNDVMPTMGHDAHSSPDWATAAQEEPGARLGKYKLIRLLGEGGMGTVWEASQDELISRRVALKVVKLGMNTKEVVARFERERQVLASMNHPNIAKVFEAGVSATGRPYFVMELVNGSPITDYCIKQELTLPERLRLFLMVGDAIGHAHRSGVIHRDLKPSNLLIYEGHVKVIDFGVAKATFSHQKYNSLYTRHAQILGTPGYMSPEQASGGEIDLRSDLYSLGVVLYELLSGVLPVDAERFEEKTGPEIREILKSEILTKPSMHGTLSIAEDLDSIVLKALSCEPEQRYQNTAEFRDDLDRYLKGETVRATQPRPLKQRVYAKKEGLILLLALVIGVGLIASFFSQVQTNTPDTIPVTPKLPLEHGTIFVEEINDGPFMPSFRPTMPHHTSGVALSLLPGKTNRGDYCLDFLNTEKQVQRGTLISSIAQNGRVTDNKGTIEYSIPSVSYSEDWSNNFISIFKAPTFFDPNNPYINELNSNCSFVRFPYQHWLAGLLIGNEFYGTEQTNIRINHDFKVVAGEGHNLNIHHLGGESGRGILLVNNAGNSPYYALSGAQEDGSFQIVGYGGKEQGVMFTLHSISFVYLDQDNLGRDGLLALGRANNDASMDVSAGEFNLTKGGIGEWLLEIPDQNPSSGTLLISPEINDDHIVSYQWHEEEKHWVIQSRDIDGQKTPTLKDAPTDKANVFSFAFFTL